MHAGENEMIRGLAKELLDVLAEVALDHTEARGFQRGVQVDLLARHCLGFDDRFHPALLREIQNVIPRLLTVAGPMNLASARGEVSLELFQILIEVIYSLVLD